MGAGNILLIVLMAATAVALIIGIALMGRGGELNRKYGNKMMTMRVMLQGAALALLAIIFMLKE